MCLFLKQGLIESLHLISSAGFVACVSFCQKCKKISTKKVKLTVVVLNNGLEYVDRIENRRIVDMKVTFHHGRGHGTTEVCLCWSATKTSKRDSRTQDKQKRSDHVIQKLRSLASEKK